MFHEKAPPKRGRLGMRQRGTTPLHCPSSICCRVSDRAGGTPGSCDIVLVRDSRLSPGFAFVLVRDRLHVPPSCARARVSPRIQFLFSCVFERVFALPSGVAALPPVPNEDDVPSGAVEVPALPSEDAEVPPAAALPPLPTVPLLPDDAPLPVVDAVCAKLA